MNFSARFAAAVVSDPPFGLQVLFAGGLALEAAGVAEAVRGHHPTMAESVVELVPAAGESAAKQLSGGGPAASVLGLVSWGPHVVKLVACDAPMPYGPLETCVVPARLPPDLKQEALRHGSHALLYYAGFEPDPIEKYVALAAVAAAVSRFGGLVILNEDARAAVPAFDLIPEEDEDILGTLRGLPIPYLWGGFVKLDVGDPDRPWARTFANARLGLPDLAYHLSSHAETGRVFQLFAGMLGYLKQMREEFTAGDTIDLGDGPKLRLRLPTELEWYLDSDGPMLVVEPQE